MRTSSQLTSWAKKQESAQYLALGSGSSMSAASSSYASVGSRGGATPSPHIGAGGGTANKVIQQLVAQGFSVEEVLALLESRPDIAAQLR